MVRYLYKEEKEKILSLYQACFDDTEEYCNYYFKKRLPQNQVAVEENDWVADREQEDSGELVIYKGMIHLIPKKIRKQETCHYLYAVATSPDFRKQGVMGRILKRVLLDLYYRGDSFTYLIPSSEENAQIYRKYGFARVMDKRVLKPEELRKEVVASASNQVNVRSAKREDIASLSVFAQRIIEQRYAIYISKDRKYFEDVLELMEIEGGEVTIYEKDGEILGYRIGFEDEVLEEVLDDSIKEYAWEIDKGAPHTMARVLNIPRMLESLETQEQGHVYVHIMDSVIEENNGVFCWEFGEKKFSSGNFWRKMEWMISGNDDFAEIGEVIPMVQVSIEDFTAHIMGYRVVDKLPKMDVKQGFFVNDYV